MILKKKYSISVQFQIASMVPGRGTNSLMLNFESQGVASVSLRDDGFDVCQLPALLEYTVSHVLGMDRLIVRHRRYPDILVTNSMAELVWRTSLPTHYQTTWDEANSLVLAWTHEANFIRVFDAERGLERAPIQLTIGPLYGLVTNSVGELWGNFAALNFVARLERSGVVSRSILPWSSDVDAYSPNQLFNHPDQLFFDDKDRLWVVNKDNPGLDVSVVDVCGERYVRYLDGVDGITAFGEDICVFPAWPMLAVRGLDRMSVDIYQHEIRDSWRPIDEWIEDG